MTPRSSTTPGVPTPMPRTGACDSATSSRASSTTVATTSSAAGRATSRRDDDVAVEGQHGADEGVAAGEVDADDAVAVAVEVDEDRGLAGTGCLAHALLDDEAVGDELGDEVGDRDPGQAGLAGEIRAAHRALVEERLQHERAVVAAGVLGEDLGALAQRAPGAEGVAVPGC